VNLRKTSEGSLEDHKKEPEKKEWLNVDPEKPENRKYDTLEVPKMNATPVYTAKGLVL